jgi:monoamine oxidase
MNIEQNNIENIAELRQFITQQKPLLQKQYERLLVQDLTQRQWDGCFQRNVLAVIEQFYQDTLTQIKTMSFDASASPIQRGLSDLTKQVLQIFDGLMDEFLLFVVDKHRTSCALSNFPDEHKPDQSYVNQVRREIAALWQNFAINVNVYFLESVE